MSEVSKAKYPLLQEILDLRGLKLKATYTNGDVADIFGVSIRTIQTHIQQGHLMPRNLPGRARFLPGDLEEYIVKSRRVKAAA